MVRDGYELQRVCLYLTMGRGKQKPQNTCALVLVEVVGDDRKGSLEGWNRVVLGGAPARPSPTSQLVREARYTPVETMNPGTSSHSPVNAPGAQRGGGIWYKWLRKPCGVALPPIMEHHLFEPFTNKAMVVC